MSRHTTGVLGLFRYLDSATDAVRRLKSEGYELTVYSPTPRHELEEALESRESPVRIFTLVGALTGAGAGAALAVWASLAWPLVVGGKEIIAMPAFVVIIFEMTILIGALSTVAGLFITAGLPRLRKGTLYHPSLSAGNFGVFAHAPADDYDVVRRIMTESGSEEVLVDEA
jgi:hypothetical protein